MENSLPRVNLMPLGAVVILCHPLWPSENVAFFEGLHLRRFFVGCSLFFPAQNIEVMVYSFFIDEHYVNS